MESVYLGSADTTEGVVNRIVSAIPPADHLATLTWLIQGTNLDSDRRYRFYHARLSESAGDRSTALAEYKALQSLSSPLERVLAQQVALGIDRISRQGAETLEQK